MRRLFSGSKLVAVAMACATVIGVCSVIGGPSASAATVQGISGDTIKVGGVFDSTTFSGTQAGFMARIDRANTTHELGKYKIDVVGIDDDTASATTDLTDVQNLVERENVFAIAPVVGEGFQQASATFATAHQVPYFGAGFVPSFCAPNTWGVSESGCAIGGDYVDIEGPLTLATAIKLPISKWRVAFAGLAIPDGDTADAAFAAVVKKYGGKVVYNKAVIPTSGGNLAPIVNAIEASKPNIIWPVVGSQAIGFEAAVTASGYTGAIVDSALYSPGLLKIAAVASAINHTYHVASTPVLESGSPWVKQLEKDYVSSGQPASAVTFGGLYGYMTADLMVAVFKKAIAENKLSGVGIHSMIEKGFTYTSPLKGGYSYKYPFMFNAPDDCASVVYVQGTVYQIKAPQVCSTNYLKVK
jgi:ABC-type branched-subunit amino acid transport system substrate-binding protein